MNPVHRLTHPICGGRGCGRFGLRGPWLASVLVAALAVAWPQPALAEPTEQEVKAALIFNITRFVEWPPKAFGSPVAPMIVAIMGQDDLGDVLEPMLLGKTVNGHPLVVRRVRTVDEARKSHVLYLARSEKRRAEAIVKSLAGSSTLTLADLEHFAERGGHINLVLEDQRVAVFVNPTSAKDSQLTISAKLLSLARIVGATP